MVWDCQWVNFLRVESSFSLIFWLIVYELIFRWSGLELWLDKFHQISTELLPLIYVRIGFHALSWAFFVLLTLSGLGL